MKSQQATLPGKPPRTAGTAAPKAGKPVRFAALREREFRVYLITTALAMMGDNVEHVISYWVLFEKFHSPVLAGFAVSAADPSGLIGTFVGAIIVILIWNAISRRKQG